MTCNGDRTKQTVGDVETDSGNSTITSAVDKLGAQLDPRDVGKFISTTLAKLSKETINECRIAINTTTALRLLLEKPSNANLLSIDKSYFVESVNQLMRLVEPSGFEWVSSIVENNSEEAQPIREQLQEFLVRKNDSCMSLLLAIIRQNDESKLLDQDDDYLVLYIISTFYYPSPWASNEAQVISRSLLSTGKNWSHDSLTRLISLAIRPRLTHNRANRHVQVTSETGRKSINAPNPSTDSDKTRYRPDFTNLDGPLWKKQVPEIGSVLRFLISNNETHISLTTNSIQEHWNLITPACLNLLDDIDPFYKISGSRVLQETLKRIEKQFLERTGLFQVFFDAIMPMLLYLPPSVEPPVSAKVLDAGYKTMEQLVLCQFPDKDTKEGDSVKRAKVIDVLFIDGIFHGAMYAEQQISVTLMLIQHATRLVELDGIYSVAHLRNLVNLVVPILSDPFISASPELLNATLALVSKLILVCWPRIHVYRFSLLKGLLLSYRWLHSDIHQDGASNRDAKQELESNIIDIVILLKAALVHSDGNDSIFNNDIEKIKQSDNVYSNLDIP